MQLSSNEPVCAEHQRYVGYALRGVRGDKGLAVGEMQCQLWGKQIRFFDVLDHNSEALKVKAKPAAQKHNMKCSVVSVFACTIS